MEIIRRIQVRHDNRVTEKDPDNFIDRGNGVIVHRRGDPTFTSGMRGVLTPEGKAIVGDPKAVVHLEDDSGRLTHRFKIAKPPKGYTELTQPQIDDLFLRHSRPKTTTGILHLTPTAVAEALKPREEATLPQVLGLLRNVANRGYRV